MKEDFTTRSLENINLLDIFSKNSKNGEAMKNFSILFETPFKIKIRMKVIIVSLIRVIELNGDLSWI